MKVLAKGILQTLVVIAITVGLMELTLRLFFADQYAQPSGFALGSEYQFWESDATNGWRRIPNSNGTFKGGGFAGEVHNDADGNRLNAATSTFIDGAPTIFMIGDSTTASLEVDDNETVSALLEQQLRAAGQQVNVLNLGVRGYGTDQAVHMALRFAEKYQPIGVIYQFTDNDIFNNNVLRQGHRLFGKGVYIKPAGTAEFKPQNYPVPSYEAEYSALVSFDNECQPTVTDISRQASQTRAKRVREWFRSKLYTAKALTQLSRELKYRRMAKRLNEQPTEKGAVAKAPELSNDIQQRLKDFNNRWDISHMDAYLENGKTRHRCNDYFVNQVEFLLKKLRNIPSLQWVYSFQFPNHTEISYLTAQQPAINNQMFAALNANGTTDGHLNLARAALNQKLDVDTLRCPGDAHFCEKGMEWTAAQLLTTFCSNGPLCKP